MGRVSLMKCFEFFKILLLVYVPINKIYWVYLGNVRVDLCLVWGKWTECIKKTMIKNFIIHTY
jgi:hypothetical protein